MLDLAEIKSQYPENLQGFEKAMLREYLQVKILQAIFESKHASKLSFLGGTALRLVHGNNRFSEDIDLDNFDLSWQAFEEVIKNVRQFLQREGFQVEINEVSKNAFHCYLRFPGLLHTQGLSPHQQEKILIQVDTITQGYDYQPDSTILNKFDVFTEVRVTPLDILLSQKIYTALHRKRSMGRDFYDITFLFSRTKPDYGFLQQKMGIATPKILKEEVLARIAGYDFESLARDVAPFLISKQDVLRVQKFKQFWQQIALLE